jgi:hypothetical protein
MGKACMDLKKCTILFTIIFYLRMSNDGNVHGAREERLVGQVIFKGRLGFML